jgi:hypothetical protein
MTPSRSRDTLRTLAAAVIAGSAALGLPGTAQAQVWTHVAAACTPDEVSIAKFDASAARFRHKGTNTGKIYARCNDVNPVDAGTQPSWNVLEFVFKDNGTGERVLAELYRVSNSSGGITLIGTVDSDDYAGSASAQTQWELLTSTVFDFYKYAYYVLITVDRTGTATLPDAAIVRLCYQLF